MARIELKKDKRPIDAQWFKDQLKRRGLSQREAALKLGINHTLISHMYAGMRKMSLEEAMQWADILKASPELVLKKAGIVLPPKILVNTRPEGKAMRDQRVELTGFVDGDLNVRFEPLKGGPTVPNPTGMLGIAAIRCMTLGGKYAGQNGMVLYFHPPVEQFDRDVIGRLCVVRVKGPDSEGYKLRVVNRGYDEGEYNLMTMAGELREEGVLLESAVPIVWMKL